ncbi:MAG: Carotene 7,8-desaturase [Planctomycetaceae bacterium]|nr:Carotene 7,8-desaturase [Planctomycetaceae bacterium]
MTESVIIIGGGLAGLAAASALATRGVEVNLLESRPRLGGRAASFLDRETDTLIDNCQHVTMGCCACFNHFCNEVGVAHLFQTADQLFFVAPADAAGRFCIDALYASPLPAPLHLVPAFRKLSYLSGTERRTLARGLASLARATPESLRGQNFQTWLRTRHQPASLIDKFWHTILVSALSESLDRIDAAIARKVFVDAFLRRHDGWKVSIPCVALDEIYDCNVTHHLAAHGATIELNAGVERLIVEDERVTGVELRDGLRHSADQFILAVSHDRVRARLPEPLVRHPTLAGLARLESAPISSVHLWFDRPITDLPHAVFIDRLSQWMFNRSTPNRGDAEEPTHYYQVVISASHDLANLTRDDVVQRVVAEFRDVWPQATRAALLHSRVVTEHKAVFAPTPGSEALRPRQQSPIGNLQLAGDWTRTGWPATMESAVRSGYLAAENVLARLRRPETLVPPHLPNALLSKLLFRL